MTKVLWWGVGRFRVFWERLQKGRAFSWSSGVNYPASSRSEPTEWHLQVINQHACAHIAYSRHFLGGTGDNKGFSRGGSGNEASGNHRAERKTMTVVTIKQTNFLPTGNVSANSYLNYILLMTCIFSPGGALRTVPRHKCRLLLK